MKEKFPEFYIDFDKLWKEAVFVFDTNVLLDILRMPKKLTKTPLDGIVN